MCGLRCGKLVGYTIHVGDWEWLGFQSECDTAGRDKGQVSLSATLGR